MERTYTNFHRAGAGLDEAAKKRRAEINERLAELGTSFSHHLLGDEQDWFMELGEDDREGLPEAFVAAARAAAEARGMAGKAIVTLSRSSVEPFLKSSARRDLREKACSGAFTARGDNGNANDNNATVVEILKPPRGGLRRSWVIRPMRPIGWKIRWPRRRRPPAASWSGSGSRPGPGRSPTAMRCRP